MFYLYTLDLSILTNPSKNFKQRNFYLRGKHDKLLFSHFIPAIILLFILNSSIKVLLYMQYGLVY